MTQETIFDLDIKEEEKAELATDYTGYDLGQYLEALKTRADHFNTSVDFERVADLQALAGLRDDTASFEKYDKMLKEDFADIYNAHFNE